jgi:manganese/zinc/iron transport system permease protein
VIALFIGVLCTQGAIAQVPDSSPPTTVTHGVGADPSTSSSFWGKLGRALTLRDYNTRVVVLGTTMLGIAAGVIGTFAYLRRRALMGDALSHATLPGIALVFILTGTKQFGALIFGAAVTGVLGVLAVIAIRRFSRLKEDAAIGIVLSVFFGIGMVLLTVIQKMSTGQEAGLQTFIYGKAAAMIRQDAQLIGWAALAVVVACVLLFKEFRAVCFDPGYARALGFPVVVLDMLMMSLVVLTTVIGLQAVGLILIVAMLIIPAAAARFWTDGLKRMVILAGLFGAVGAWLGATISALLPRMPTGAVIVVTSGALFLVSLFIAPRRGLLANLIRQRGLRRKVGYQHLLRALAECEEQLGEEGAPSFMEVLAKRSWTAFGLRKVVRRAFRAGDVAKDHWPRLVLTPAGREQARRILRNHRLWEMFLIKYADIAPSHVDRDADEVEHVLSDRIIRELDEALAQQARIPPSPHLEEAPA